jgi:hypothetical protein
MTTKESLTSLSNALFTELNAMPYFRNFAAASGAPHNYSKHEEAVEAVFKKHGFTVWKPTGREKITKGVYKSWINTPSLATKMPSMSYTTQPCGTQDSPDFIIKLAEKVVLGIECKSAEDTTPMYNSGSIKRNFIYIFCSKDTDKTTIYVGGDILTCEQETIIEELIKEQKALEEKCNKKLQACDLHKRGISYYTRPMIYQAGGKALTNYFTHPHKEQNEKNVHLFVEAMIEASFS